MALTETRSLSNRLKSRCQSAPLQRRRTLDEFPMNYSRIEAMAMAQKWRNNKLLKNDNISRITEESDNLREYGRKRFDYVVKSAKADLVANRKISCDRLPVTPYNGPSRYGSPLYNKTPSLLSTIRLRPQSEYGYTHKPQEHPEIQRALLQSNDDYNLRLNLDSELSGTTTPVRTITSDYLFVPKSTSAKSMHETFSNWTDLNDSCVSPDYNLSQTIITSPKRRLSSKFLDYVSSASSSTTSESEMPQGLTSGTENPEENSTIPLQVPESSDTTPLPVQEANLSNPPPVEKEPKEKPRPRKSRRSRPKCWVDDVTVSSEPSVHLTPEVPVEPEDKEVGQTGTEQHPTLPEPPVKTAAQLAEELLNPDDVVGGDNPELVREEFNILNLEDVKERQIELPKFLCPSSEEKSRQVAIKDWLAGTCFTSARHQIPMY
ncbi:hypothetical protein LOTGIDRAFT_157815 [Lottia gigantea]|uniref:Uncharacterized protein n=1 Tax=Lottia gigantea TaxID=225164 RepID=V4AZI0_LOTGI|nr:hypothetical protein LOTGIDRAFT_157815 [Lottia gigantea]ESP00541.1 hypothetical protein LOTGIDRAFT_157815 [Lottia gigantea]